jgi:LysM repeat protein
MSAALAFTVVAAAAVSGAANSSKVASGRKEARPAEVPAATKTIVVQRGDSLWSLARRYGRPGDYILDRVDVIAQANGISAATPLLPGERIAVPIDASPSGR